MLRRTSPAKYRERRRRPARATLPRDDPTSTAGPETRTEPRPEGGRSAPATRLDHAAFGVLAIGVFIGVMSIYASFTSDLPDIGEIENFSLDQASTVVSADGKELATFAVEDCDPVGIHGETSIGG